MVVEVDLAAEATSAAAVVAVAEVTSPVDGDSAVVEQDFTLLDHDSAVALAA